MTEKRQTIREALGRQAINRKIVIAPEMFYSEAFHSLTKAQQTFLLRLLQKRTWIGGKKKKQKFEYENDGLIFTKSEAAKFKISGSSYTRAINELYEKGFIEIQHQGGTIGNGKDPSQYKLIKDYLDWGTPKFKERKPRNCVKQNDSLKEYNARRKEAKQNKTKTKSRVMRDTGSVSSVTQ